MNRHLTATWLAILILVLAACGPAAESPTGEPQPTAEGTDAAAAADPIRIGVSLPLTGDFTEPGEGVQRGYEVWASDVNAAGGLLGRPVELIIVDDASDANRVVSDYERLITVDEVDLLFGPFSSRLVIPASEVAERYEMLFVEPAGAAPDVFNRGLEYLFYAAPATADRHGVLFSEYILGLPEGERPTTAAYPILDDPFAMATAEGVRTELEANGIETVFTETYPPEQTDFATIAAEIADSGAELVVGGTQFEDAVGLVRGMQELGYQPMAVIMTTGPTLPDFDEAVGGAAEGIFSPVGWSLDADLPSNVAFIESYRAMFDGEDPSEDPANAYTVGQVVAQAVEAVGSVEDQAALRDYIRENEFETVVGPLSFNERGEPQGAHMILQWQGGTMEIVLAPDESAVTSEPIYPKPAW
jgi:branched-chain amino acid transport system substrate-binding protein